MTLIPQATRQVVGIAVILHFKKARQASACKLKLVGYFLFLDIAFMDVTFMGGA